MAEKTERASDKRLREAREKGQVPKSQEVPSAATVVAVFGYFVFGWDYIMAHLSMMVDLPITWMLENKLDSYSESTIQILMHGAALSLPPIVLASVAGILSNLIQVGILVSFESIKISSDSLSFKKWFQNTFAMKNLLELLKNIIKVLIISLTIKVVLDQYIPALLGVLNLSIDAVFGLVRHMLFDFVLYITPIFVVVAVLDYLLQNYQFMESMKMSKDEVKQEHKDMEGDQDIKTKRKELHRELVTGDTPEKVKKSTVLVTNPTHYAVALYYGEGETPLPIVMAKGKGAMALWMIEIAKEAKIPIMRNIPLARGLYATADEMQYIPEEYIVPVAEVLKWLRTLQTDDRRPKS